MPPNQPTAVAMNTAPRQANRRSFETISIVALLATIVIAVFFFIPSSAVPTPITKAFVLAIGMLVTLAAYVLARLGRGNVILPPLMLIGALWLPVIAYALSAAFSGVSFLGAFWGSALDSDTLGFMLVVAFLGTLSALILRRSEQYKMFLRTAAWVFGIVALIEVAMIVAGQFAPDTISPSFSFLGSFEDVAFLLGLGVIGVLITFRFVELGRRARLALIAAVAVSLALIAIVNSPLVWTLVALVSFGLFVEALMKGGLKPSDTDLDDVSVVGEAPLEEDDGNRSLIFPLAVFIVSLFFFVGGAIGEAMANALHVNTLSVRPSWQSTFTVAQNVYATQNIFGSGPGTFGAEWLKYRDPALNSTVFWNIDFFSGIGFIPTSFVTTGLVGAAAWVVFLLLFIALGLRMLIKRAPEDAYIRYVAILSFIASLYLIAIAIFGVPSPVLLMLAFVFVGIFASTTRFATRGVQWGIIFARSPRLGFVIVLFLMTVLLASVAAAYVLAGRYIATNQLASAGASLAAGDLDKASQSVQNALSFSQSAAAHQIEAGIANARIGQILASTTLSPEAAQKAFQESLSSGITAGLSATRLNPADYKNWIALGTLYARAVPFRVSGAYEGALSAYGKAKALNPTNPQILHILAQLDIAQNNIKGAKENLKAAIMLKQDYTAAIFLLSQLEVQDGNVRGALDAALAAAYFSPNDPNILFQIGVLRAAQNDLAGAREALSAAVSANPKFANARYFLSAVYAKQGDMESALAQMKEVAAMSSDNAKAVATQLSSLEKGKNPFPANLLSVSPSSVKP